jgi:signal peptidase I
MMQSRIGGRRSLRRSLGIATILLTALAAAAFLSYRNALLRAYVVTSSSMEPTLHCSHAPGCRSLSTTKVIVSRVPYFFSSPGRGDVVVIALRRSMHPCAGSFIVKRIVALPNETVEQHAGSLFVSGHQLPEPYLSRQGQISNGPSVAATQLGRRQFFVMGDNRSMSCDSREFGPIDRSEIVGEVVARF